MNKKANYGWTNNLYDQAKAVVDCLGGGENAYNLILETSATETALGQMYDGTIYAGMGICQFDKVPFYRVRKKSLKFRDKIFKDLGVDIKLVEWEHLRYNSFLSLIFCRLYYLTIAEPIPATLEGRAGYWKKYYNSYLGKGTPKHYTKMVSRFVNDTHGYLA